MKKFLLLVFMSLSFHAFSQINYEPGYLITNEQVKTEIFILNKDWRDNPTTFTYKTSLSGKAETARIEDITEFGAGDYMKYKKFNAPIDRSGVTVSNMSRQEEPEFQTQTVFLRQLVGGEIDLYVFKEGSLERFFIFTPAKGLEPLVFKEYLRENKIATNKKFRQQLYRMGSCGEFSSSQLRKVGYRKKDLVEYFRGYNECLGNDYQLFQEEGNKLKFNFSVKAGLDFAKLTVSQGLYLRDAEIEFEPSFRLGADFEIVMPFNRNKWAVFLEPSYTGHQVEREHFVSYSTYDNHEVDLTIDLKSITILFGARHYLFLNDSSKFFLSGGVSFDVPLESNILIDRDERYEIDPELHTVRKEAYVNLGLGYKFQKFSAEARYNSPKMISGSRDVHTHYNLDWDSEVTSFSVILGYSIF